MVTFDINLNILECKLYSLLVDGEEMENINLNILECK